MSPRDEPASGPTPVTPVDAAALVLVRGGDKTPEVLMAQRRKQASFAPGAWVFPGGIVEPQDRDAPEIPGLQANVACQQQVCQTNPHAYWWAAAREALEEVRLAPGLDEQTARELFAELGTDACFADLLVSAGIHGALADMAFCGYLVTPPPMPRRYATRFFMAACDGEPQVDGDEIIDARWVSPDAALTAYASGDFPIIFPQLMQLRRYAEFTSAAALLDWARSGAGLPATPGDEFV